MKNLYDFFYCNYLKKKKSIFIKINNKVYSFQNIYKKILQLENCLSQYKIKPGEQLCIISKNSIDHVVLYLLCSKKKLIFVALDPNSKTHVIENIIKKLKINYIFKKKIKFLKVNNFNYKRSTKEKKFRKQNLLNDIFYLTFSSGTTGVPKPIYLSEHKKIIRAQAVIDQYLIKKSDRIIISTPFHHSLAIRLLTLSIIEGLFIVIIDYYNFKTLINKIYNEKITFTILVADQIKHILLNNNNFKYLKFIRCIVSSSSPISPAMKNSFINKINFDFHECYGLSEGAILTSINLKKETSFSKSVGKPISGVNIIIKKIRNSNYGEIFFKSPYLIDAIYDNKIKKIDKNKIYPTGDLGRLDKKGYLHYLGRKNNFIKIKGINVDLNHLRNKILELNFVEKCEIIVMENKYLGTFLILCYTVKNNITLQPHKIKEKIIKFLNTNFTAYYFPRYFLQLKSMPINSIGKINLYKLKKEVEKKISD